MKKIIIVLLLISAGLLNQKIFADMNMDTSTSNKTVILGRTVNENNNKNFFDLYVINKEGKKIYTLPITILSDKGNPSINYGDTFYAITLADSTTFIRGGIPADATAITESIVEKIDPVSKNAVWREEYDFVYDGNGKLIGIHLK